MSRFRNALEMSPTGKGSIAADRAPMSAERAALVARLSVIEKALRPADVKAARQIVAQLFMLFPLQGDARDMGAITAEYATALASEPLWAIHAACVAIIDDGAEFRPSAPRLLKVARKATEAVRAEAWQIASVLNASVYTVPDRAERDRRAGILRELSKQLEMRAA